MSDYSAVAPPQNFSQSSAFAAALQRAKQIAAKINPSLANETGSKRPLEDNSDGPEAKKVASESGAGRGSSAAAAAAAQAAAVAARVAAAAAAGIQGLGVPGLALGPVTNEDIRVPDKMVGLSRGGEQISRLQSESGCKIQMAPDSGGQPERVCTLTGNAQAISRAKELINAIVQQRSRTEGTGGARLDDMNMGGPPSSHFDFSQTDDDDGPSNIPPFPFGNRSMKDDRNDDGPSNKMPFQFGNKTTVEIMVPGPKVGLIIGKGGETIKQLQEKSGAKMVVIQDGPSQENEKPLRITGEPQKVEHAKALVYELIAEKEMQNAFNRGGGNGGGGNRGNFGNDFNGGGGGGGDSVEVAVPRAAVGVVIGKGGDMIKKIQGETGARVQFQQGRDDGPGDRRCLLTGKPEQVEDARIRIEELIDSVLRRDSESGRGGGRGGGGGGGGRGGGGSFDRMGGGGGPPREFNERGRGWDNNGRMGGPGGDKTESTFTVPAAKCGVIIGRGGETIKQINQQTGAHCELDRRPPANPAEKTFVIRGLPDQIENAKRLIAEKLGMPGPPGGNAGPPQQYGMGGPGGPQQHFGGQNWQAPGGFQQPWQNQSHPQDPSQGAGQVQVNPQTGQPDYSAQWVDYYRSLGMHREAEVIEQQAKANKGAMPGGAAQGAPGVAGQPQAQSQPVAAAAAQNGQPDYSAQWADYYRSIGKLKEAEAIEATMKNKQAAVAAGAGPQPGPTPTPAANPYPQAGYGYPQAAGAFYGGAPGAPQPGAPQPAAPQYAQYPNYAAYAQQTD
ncbi:far upstream element-binding protein 3-like isoform X2 [Macrosteles quadrilineatus]|uniref:far upstream element-binding protein 3-like isoform X2 n=1 Tax=Macrosteles quadrilineatus TaxID=74068 RepID=UPI0023E34F4D|nr:far upstream element-binding protein 3-like isoform X2 [Macrosteles quadrilineatus]XP_054275611.1 far upstream element-binding protein 3-like isoform X2 [Macrosteles quadrilineatus]